MRLITVNFWRTCLMISFFHQLTDSMEPKKLEVNLNEDRARAVSYPCQCLEGDCGCCTGAFLGNFVKIRNRMCANVTYFPEDFEFDLRLSFNDAVFLDRRVSGKNPPPLCAALPIPALNAIKMCVVFNNIYAIGRNIHMCLNIEGKFRETVLFGYSFDCMRVGADGIAFLKPEEGGGLGPPKPIKENVTAGEDYDAIVASEGDDIQSGRFYTY